MSALLVDEGDKKLLYLLLGSLKVSIYDVVPCHIRHSLSEAWIMYSFTITICPYGVSIYWE